MCEGYRSVSPFIGELVPPGCAPMGKDRLEHTRRLVNYLINEYDDDLYIVMMMFSLEIGQLHTAILSGEKVSRLQDGETDVNSVEALSLITSAVSVYFTARKELPSADTPRILDKMRLILSAEMPLKALPGGLQ